ncbi:hypothetical protein [Macrococcus capreoli]|uniref:hypothetical protein n=1 Tax=Macrococcus capreoli TaxID=2982690 RepID=UPI0021D5D12B|nr:hypothetical protein [Macrococcus sp. TMW 2.2395]MCU7558279.1 hypothetical protein [Macrococcus sp. TMW 2.2395]
MKIQSKEELLRAKKAAMKVVQQRSATSGAVAAVPIPGVDVATDIGLIMELVAKINRRFGLTPEEIEDLDADEKQKIVIIVTSIGSNFIGKVLTKELVVQVLKKMGVKVTTKQVAKYIPFAGAIIAGSISYGAMYQLGKSHVDECFEVCERILKEQGKW